MLKQHEKYSRAGLSNWGKRVKLQSTLDEATLVVSMSLRDLVDRSTPATDEEISSLEAASCWAGVEPPPPCATHNRHVSRAFTDEIRRLANKPSAGSVLAGSRQKDADKGMLRNRKGKKAAKRTLRLALRAYVAEIDTLLRDRK